MHDADIIAFAEGNIVHEIPLHEAQRFRMMLEDWQGCQVYEEGPEEFLGLLYWPWAGRA